MSLHWKLKTPAFATASWKPYKSIIPSSPRSYLNLWKTSKRPREVATYRKSFGPAGVHIILWLMTRFFYECSTTVFQSSGALSDERVTVPWINLDLFKDSHIVHTIQVTRTWPIWVEHDKTRHLYAYDSMHQKKKLWILTRNVTTL